MIPNPAKVDETNSNSEVFARWQTLFFPKRALMYHESTRQRIMSHVDLRRRTERKNRQYNQEEEKQETGEPIQSLTDELNESDLNVNELLISEFKLMNKQMRDEIRSIYRLLVIFVVIVIGMAVGGIVFCGDFMKNISDFHYAAFNPQMIQTFSDMKGTVDFFSTQYKKWYPVVHKSFQNTPNTTNATDAYLMDNSFSRPVIISEEEVLLTLTTCDECIFQFDPNSVATRNLNAMLKLIRENSDSPEPFSISEMLGSHIIDMPVLSLVYSSWILMKHEMGDLIRSKFWWSQKNKTAASPQDKIFPKLMQNMIGIISTSTKCQTAKDIKHNIGMAITFMMDLPLGRLFEPKYMDQIVGAKSIITFPYKRLLCGHKDEILSFHHTILQSNTSVHETFYFIALDLDKNKNGDMSILLPDFHLNSTIVIGIPLRIELLDNFQINKDLNGTYINLHFCASLGLIVLNQSGIEFALTFTWRDPALDETFEFHLKFENLVDTDYVSIKTQKYAESDKHLMLLAIQQLSIEQYSQELMHKISHDIGGMILKLCQVLAVREDVITSPIIRKAFKEASDNNPAKDERKVIAVLENEFGAQRFANFTSRYEIQFPALKAGSVGQVHVVHSRNNTQAMDMMLKVTFDKEITTQWRQQWELLQMLGESDAIPIFHSCWDTISSIDDKLFGEINFDQESMYTQLARRALYASDSLSVRVEQTIKKGMLDMGFNLTASYLPCHIVRIVEEWSSKHVLMQQKAEGKNLKDWLQTDLPSFEQKAKVFKSLIVWWAYLAFQEHIVHSDPHYGNIMVACDEAGDPVHITLIDFGQTDLFVKGADNGKHEWFLTFKKLMRKINGVYDSDEIAFGENVESLLENLKAKLIEEDGLYKLAEKTFLESIHPQTQFNNIFLADLAAIMMELGFESERNTPRLLAGLAMGALNNDPRYAGAKKTQQNVLLDPLKTFPPNAALIFRAVTGIVGMLDDQQTIHKGRSLTDNSPLVPMFIPFMH